MSARSWLQRTHSFHHIGPSDGLGGISTDWTNPIIILQKSADPATSGLQIPSRPTSSNESVTRCGKYSLPDIMRDKGCLKQHLLSAKQEFSTENGDKLMNNSLNENLSDVKQLDRGISSHQFMECVDVLELFKVNKKLFLEILQDPDVQAAKNFHVQLNSNKKKEIWSFPKEKKFPAGIEVPMFVASKDSHDKPMGLRPEDSGVFAVTQEINFSSFVSSQGTNKHGWHQSFMIHLKYVMKKIKHMLKESKKEDKHASMNTIPYGVPSGCKLSTDEKDAPARLKEVTTHLDGKENSGSYQDTNDSDNDLSKGQLPHIRRISSLNESADRYARLFEFSLTKKAKWHDFQSKSLKLTNEDKFTSTGNSLKTFRRRLSLPDLESFCPLPNETSHNSIHSGIPFKTSTDYDTNAENVIHNDLKSESICVAIKQFEPREAVEDAEFRKTYSADRGNDENAYTVAGDHSMLFELNEPDDTDFNYVRDVLEVSGFIEQGCRGTWHSLDQPLSPTLFKELEAYLNHELECSSEDVGSNCDHQLLFDLINEVLLQIYKSSLAYFPESFSFTQRVRPLPKGNHTLEEVWKRISWYRSIALKTTQSLDDIMAQDMAKDDGWMNFNWMLRT
ncbi:hypothetical protein GH714_012309 [Hevea brasiliensis]|uniref:DUF3741 domain-containing protein n=1 Tax=Hevea brasiliensis TaxID=3981 RepID=A0A6A6LJS3_HEVBR|nr:hypothetical protein GH714_012309 [Hevea brasiliensis]